MIQVKSPLAVGNLASSSRMWLWRLIRFSERSWLFGMRGSGSSLGIVARGRRSGSSLGIVARGLLGVEAVKIASFPRAGRPPPTPVSSRPRVRTPKAPDPTDST
jgi:hypothetical protein